MDIWPLRPNWRDPYRVTYSFATEIIVSKSGREQRRARRSTPRKTMEFLVLGDGPRWPMLAATLVKNQGPLLYMPEYPGVQASGTMAAAGHTLPVAEVPDWAVAGAKVALVEGDRVLERTISSTVGGLTFVEAAPSAWGKGTRAAPLRQGRIPPSVQVMQHIPSIAEATIQFDVDPASEPAREPVAAETTFNGREVFVEIANWGSPRDVTFSHPYSPVDYGRGKIKVFQPVPFSSEIRTADYLATTQAEAYRLIDFFHRHKGRRGEFYCPSDSADIQLADSTSNAFLFVDGTLTAEAYGASAAHKAVSFRLKDGTRFYRTVVAVTAQGAQSRIQLNAAVPGVLNPDEVEVISWMPVLRNATDDLTVEWVTDQVARMRFTYQSLQALAAE